MNIGIVIAVAEELSSFFNGKYETEKLRVNNRDVYKAVINQNTIYVTTSGYGKIDASSATEFLITKYDCKAIINYGVTGALTRDLKVEDLFVVTKTVNHDFDISPIEPVAKHQYLDFPTPFIPLDENLIGLVKKLYPNIKEAIVASGDRFVELKEDKINLARETKCNICDMEIAGIAKTAIFNKVPCLSIKCISDTFDGDGKDFLKNVRRSAEIAFNLIEKILETL